MYNKKLKYEKEKIEKFNCDYISQYNYLIFNYILFL